MKNETDFKEPVVAGFCLVFAWLSILIGGFMLVIGCTEVRTPGAGSIIGAAFAILFGSVVWVALHRVIVLLAQIEWNTRK